MKLLKSIVNKKINNLTIAELFSYCKKYQIEINEQQAEQVITTIHQQKRDIYNEQDRLDLLNKISEISNATTAKKVNQLLQKLL